MTMLFTSMAELDDAIHASVRVLWLNAGLTEGLERDIQVFVKNSYPGAHNIVLGLEIPIRFCHTVIARFDIDIQHKDHRYSRYKNPEIVGLVSFGLVVIEPYQVDPDEPSYTIYNTGLDDETIKAMEDDEAIARKWLKEHPLKKKDGE